MMTEIKVTRKTEIEFVVHVKTRTSTEHHVTLPFAYYQKLTRGTISQEELIKKSFEFLLERESNTSILRSFELSLISSYFPAYESTILKSF